MKQLKPLEASFLPLESPTQSGHRASLAILDIPENAEDSIFPALCRALAPRIARLASLRQRLVPVPLHVSAISYDGELHFGLTACRSLMPELAEVGRGFAEGLAQLCERAQARGARVVH